MLKSMALCITISLFLSAVAMGEGLNADGQGDSDLQIHTADHPQRIVSLSPSNTEILFALGLGPNVVGVTKYCNYPPQLQELRDSGRIAEVGGYSDPDLEKILSLQPDLIVANRIHSDSISALRKESEIPTFIADARDLDGIIQSIEMIGNITGREGEASLLTGQMEARVKAISEKVSATHRPSVLYILWHDPVRAAGRDTFEDQLIEMAGGENIFHDLSGYPQVDPESIAERDPEVIIACTGMGAGADLPFDWAKTVEGLNLTQARREGRIYQADGDLVTRSGPRIVDGLEIFARFIHPEAFGKPA
ncbi:MAG TPA: cobalamin-binding protein [Methanotrichaceae archaeon]|nr:cobalamin-binding protein [Methanotrichaceae archaeon]HQF15597.1 cobalamin-binding protein [Methanotrichaceae archaeon]HQI90333.1 cobalamin-binding protein [Methanotrichaceae archaeon]HQJ28575.1 cobalamin-binding protein [Methanotrichaceae archaeon]